MIPGRNICDSSPYAKKSSFVERGVHSEVRNRRIGVGTCHTLPALEHCLPANINFLSCLFGALTTRGGREVTFHEISQPTLFQSDFCKMPQFFLKCSAVCRRADFRQISRSSRNNANSSKFRKNINQKSPM